MWFYKDERQAKCTVEYLQNKIKINFREEEIRYKRLYNNLGFFERKLINGYSYSNHQEWEEKMRKHVCHLQDNELQELNWWLDNKVVIINSSLQMASTFALAFAVAVFSEMLSEVLVDIVGMGDSIKFISLIIIFGLVMFFSRKAFTRLAGEEVQREFYVQLQKIVKKVIIEREKKRCKKRKTKFTNRHC